MLIYGRHARTTHVNLPADNSHRCIRLTQHCFKGEGVVTLRCRPDIYYCLEKCFTECMYQELLAEIVHIAIPVLEP